MLIHSKNNIKREVIIFILCLIPLYLYGLYKNGILLYLKDMISFLAIFKIIFLLLISLVAYLIVNICFKKKLKFDYDLLCMFIIPLFMPQGINVGIFFGGLFGGLVLYNLFSKYIGVNKRVFLILVIFGILWCFNDLYFLNEAEEAGIYKFNTWDLLWGRGVGGLGSSSIIWGVIVTLGIALLTNYKVLLVGSFFVSSTILALVLNDYDILLNSFLALGGLLVLSDNKSTPYENISMIIYGGIVGIMSVLLIHFGLTEIGVFISIFMCSLLLEIILFVKKKCCL